MAPAARYTPEEQESLILNAAIQCIERSTLLDFTMSAISKTAGLSMGSVYRHIQSKEDVLVALAANSFAHLHTVFSDILQLPIDAPQKLIAVQLATPEKLHLYSFGPQLEVLVSSEHVLKRASANWIKRMVENDKRIDNLFSSFFNHVWDSAELREDSDNKEQILDQLSVSFWSLCVGYQQVAMQTHARGLVCDTSPWPWPLAADNPIILTAMRLLNSYNWQQPINSDDINAICDLLLEKSYR